MGKLDGKSVIVTVQAGNRRRHREGICSGGREGYVRRAYPAGRRPYPGGGRWKRR